MTDEEKCANTSLITNSFFLTVVVEGPEMSWRRSSEWLLHTNWINIKFNYYDIYTQDVLMKIVVISVKITRSTVTASRTHFSGLFDWISEGLMNWWWTLEINMNWHIRHHDYFLAILLLLQLLLLLFKELISTSETRYLYVMK
jgi:hypothetical protein